MIIINATLYCTLCISCGSFFNCSFSLTSLLFFEDVQSLFEIEYYYIVYIITNPFFLFFYFIDSARRKSEKRISHYNHDLNQISFVSVFKRRRKKKNFKYIVFYSQRDKEHFFEKFPHFEHILYELLHVRKRSIRKFLVQTNTKIFSFPRLYSKCMCIYIYTLCIYIWFQSKSKLLTAHIDSMLVIYFARIFRKYKKFTNLTKNCYIVNSFDSNTDTFYISK